jgi:hypothetical protein
VKKKKISKIFFKNKRFFSLYLNRLNLYPNEIFLSAVVVDQESQPLSIVIYRCFIFLGKYQIIKQTPIICREIIEIFILSNLLNIIENIIKFFIIKTFFDQDLFRMLLYIRPTDRACITYSTKRKY